MKMTIESLTSSVKVPLSMSAAKQWAGENWKVLYVMKLKS